MASCTTIHVVGVFCADEHCHPPILYAELHGVEPTLSWESIGLRTPIIVSMSVIGTL
jgi:hypothetical protein